QPATTTWPTVYKVYNPTQKIHLPHFQILKGRFFFCNLNNSEKKKTPMSAQHTQYALFSLPPLSMGNAAQYNEDLDFNSDFTIFDNEPPVRTTNNSTPMSNDKQSEFFLSFGHELSDPSFNQPAEPIYSFNFEPITPLQPTPYDSPYQSPLMELFDTPITAPHNTPFFTPYQSPFEDFAEDPELSPAVSFKEYENDEGYGTTEYNRLYPNHFDGNPFTLVCTPAEDRPHDFDDDESAGSLFAPLSNNRDDYIIEDASGSRPANRKRKSSDSSDTHRNVAHDSPPRRFPCKHPGCDKAFARLFNLTTHEKTHDPHREKPFSCKDCPKTFARKHDLYRHEASVHRGERLFSCKRCTKPFSRKDALRRHVSVKGCPGTVSPPDASSPTSSELSSSEM
ncbi:hypothetical protein BC938DRAFT_477373, partial [Jimgerdemannia flammicorona]